MTHPHGGIENQEERAARPGPADARGERRGKLALAPFRDREQLRADRGEQQPDVLTHPHRSPGVRERATATIANAAAGSPDAMGGEGDRQSAAYVNAAGEPGAPRVVHVLIQFSHGGERAEEDSD